MSTKTTEDHLNNSRLGAYAESLVKTFLLEYCDFAYDTMEKHPADLLAELSTARYSIQVKARNKTAAGKYVFATENARNQSETYRRYCVDIIAFVLMPDKRILFKSNSDNQTYYTFGQDIITPGMEIESFQATLNQLSAIPILNPLLK
jgi:hypothetical protein|tara:strand:+ start:58 stop:501 length:444 start_codon:yes stop_codon:yes gene_type:complete